jgi:hypothetical protein
VDIVNKLIELFGLGDLSPLSMIALAVGAFLLLGGGKIDFAGLLAKLKGLLPKASGVAAPVSDASARLAAAHLIRTHLQAMHAPADSITAFDTHIAPYVWVDVEVPVNG